MSGCYVGFNREPLPSRWAQIASAGCGVRRRCSACVARVVITWLIAVSCRGWLHLKLVLPGGVREGVMT